MGKNIKGIILYSSKTGARLNYIVHVIFSEILGIDYSITTAQQTFKNSSLVKINYSLSDIPSDIKIIPFGLLEESYVCKQGIQVSKWGDLPVFFQTQSQDLPFDLFSAAFYLVSRYEEYLPYNPDPYGRFGAEDCLSFKNGFLRLPIVDLWCKKLTRILKIENQCTNLSEANYRFRLTIDIDQPWMFKNRGWLYATGSLLRELISFNFSQFSMRLKVITGIHPDPADTYNFISDVQTHLDQPVCYFILCRNKGDFDSNRSICRRKFRQLVQILDKAGRVGLHPSYVSFTSEKKLKQEIILLSEILKRKITHSRQHFLLLNFPDTYRKIIKYEIAEDFSMGCSSQTGFRAGIARSYNFFDLSRNEATDLRIVPFQIMDRTLLTYMKLSADDAIKEFEYFTNTIRNVGGEFVCLWHNDSLSDWGEWKGWKRVFNKMIEMNSSR